MISLALWSIVAFRLAKLDFCEPVNIGSDEMVGMNEMAEIVHSFENKNIPIKSHSRLSWPKFRQTTLIKEELSRAPTMKLEVLTLFNLQTLPSYFHFI